MDKSAADRGRCWVDSVSPGESGKVQVHLSPDWLVDLPVEVVDDDGPGYVDAAMLGISDSLAQDLESFQEWWEEHSPLDGDDDAADVEGPGWAQWRQEGWRLVARLRRELGAGFEVVWIGHTEPPQD